MRIATIALLFIAALAVAEDAPKATSDSVKAPPVLSFEQKYAARTLQVRVLAFQQAKREVDAEQRKIEEDYVKLREQFCGAGFDLDFGASANDVPSCKQVQAKATTPKQ